MAYRTLYFDIEKAKTTSSEGDKIDFLVSGENSAFGSNRPYYFDFEFNSSYLYANYSGGVTMKWSLALKINGTRYEIYSDSSTMSKSDSDFSGSGYLPDNVINLLKSYPIDEVSVFQDGSRVIKGTSSAYGSMTIDYEEIEPSLTAPTVTSLTQNGDKINISWTHSTYTDGSYTRKYMILYKTDTMINNGDTYATLVEDLTSNTYTGTIPSDWYGQGVSLWVIAYADDVPYTKWSSTASIIIQRLGSVCYYHNGQWKKCIPYYHNGTKWVKCEVYYHNGTKWNLSNH